RSTGCTDTDNNTSDFVVSPPTPRNAASPVYSCGLTPPTTNFSLSVSKTGTGTGTVSSVPAGISCGSTCAFSFASSTSVTLTARASTGSTFGGWSGDCTGMSACTVAMTQARSVTAAFNPATVTTTTPTPTIGGAPVIFPHFVQGSGYQTSFTFNNLSDRPATITLNFYAQNGDLIGTAPLNIAQLGSARYAMTGSVLTLGWARASVNPAIELVGTETIQLFN